MDILKKGHLATKINGKRLICARLDEVKDLETKITKLNSKITELESVIRVLKEKASFLFK